MAPSPVPPSSGRGDVPTWPSQDDPAWWCIQRHAAALDGGSAMTPVGDASSVPRANRTASSEPTSWVGGGTNGRVEPNLPRQRDSETNVEPSASVPEATPDGAGRSERTRPAA